MIGWFAAVGGQTLGCDVGWGSADGTYPILRSGEIPPSTPSTTMPPFRNLLGRKPQPNPEDPVVFDENHLSPGGPAPIPIRNSHDEPTEYKLSGMIVP